MVKPLWSYKYLFRNYEDDGKEEDAVKTYEKILKINPEDRYAIDSIHRLKELEREAQELGFDLKFVCFINIYILMLDLSRSVFIVNFFLGVSKEIRPCLQNSKNFCTQKKARRPTYLQTLDGTEPDQGTLPQI